jgi:hypothetical protein
MAFVRGSHFLLLAGFCFSVHADMVTATLDVGTSPFAVAVNPVTNKIYVANLNDHPACRLPASSEHRPG